MKVIVSALSLFSLAVSTASVRISDSYIPVPGGYVHPKCSHKVSAGAALKQHPDGLMVTEANGKSRLIPKCNVSAPVFVRSSQAEIDSDLPFNYDGWTSYTAYEAPQGTSFDTFTNNFSVPLDIPKQTPEKLFIFPGLQNQDWIPKVDPEPTSGFDIIQPVLQYPGDIGKYWSVKSWYVTTDIGTVESSEIRLQPGDVIFGNMTRLEGNKWLIDSVLTRTGKSTSVTVEHDRLSSQPWAYNTVECYGCRSCDTYPVNPTIFTAIDITQGGKKVQADWKINPKPPAKTFCKETAVVKGPDAVTFTFV